MKIKVDVWKKLNGKDNKPYDRLYHEEFSEEEIIEILTKELKEKYHEPFSVEINEITSR